jgi:hypothetical protein
MSCINIIAFCFFSIKDRNLKKITQLALNTLYIIMYFAKYLSSHFA